MARPEGDALEHAILQQREMTLQLLATGQQVIRRAEATLLRIADQLADGRDADRRSDTAA